MEEHEHPHKRVACVRKFRSFYSPQTDVYRFANVAHNQRAPHSRAASDGALSGAVAGAPSEHAH